MPTIRKNSAYGAVKVTKKQRELIDKMRKAKVVEVRNLGFEPDEGQGRLSVFVWDGEPYADGSRTTALFTLDADGMSVGRTTYKDGRIAGLTHQEVEAINDGHEARWEAWMERLMGERGH
jgi:hypothetical protein